MAYQSVWYETRLSEDVLNTLNSDITESDLNLGEAYVGGRKTGSSSVGTVDNSIRDTQVSWLRTEHWIAPFLMYYVDRANRENFFFDIQGIDRESLQYTLYGPGKFYNWHRDDSLASKLVALPHESKQLRPEQTLGDKRELCRKLSFSLLLSDSSDYEGGQFQLMGYDNKMYEVPQKLGTLVIFDSTTIHRVRPVKKGTRKSLVGWVVGPRWR